MTVEELKAALRKVASAEKAVILARFFKTGKGEYGEGDKFLGVVVPAQRMIVKAYFSDQTFPPVQTTLNVVEELLQGGYHEERLTALLILVEQYKKGDDRDKERIFLFYLSHLEFINNWDLVDLSAPNIVGDYLVTRKPSLLYKLARNKSIWARRVAILATFAFIKFGHFSDTLALAKLLLIDKKDPHDLMHKAVGWMLREVGKRDSDVLEEFLEQFAAQLPRTALRYAIERFPEAKRQQYLALGRPTKSAR